MFWVS